MHVLIVDDDHEIADLVATVLREMGHEVSLVGSGSAALAAALRQEFDLMICDLMLPDLQGDEIVRAVKAQSPRLPVIVMSALEARDWAKACEDAGATRYLQKPVGITELRQEVALVDKARLRLRISLVDPDHFHGTRLTKALTALGCEVQCFLSTHVAAASAEGFGLFVIDAGAPGAVDLVRAAKARNVPAFVFAEKADAATEDQLMRAGAAFMLAKPIDVDALLTQAAFMLS
jgi:DNA-binding response OmpR family regulator